MNEKKIYNLNQIEGACVLGSPIVAGILIAHMSKPPTSGGEFTKSVQE